MIPNTTVSPDLRLKLDAVYDGGPGEVKVDNPVWSSEGRE